MKKNPRKSARITKKPLETSPVLDVINVAHCQAVKHASFMQLGGPPTFVCNALPTWIVFERSTKHAGGMALCDDCKAVCMFQAESEGTVNSGGKARIKFSNLVFQRIAR